MEGSVANGPNGEWGTTLDDPTVTAGQI